MKTVFKSDEIAHIWANNQTNGATHGRVATSSYMNGGSGSRMSFDGDAFRSYNTVIARRISHKGKTAYIVDMYCFSPTTSGHQSAVKGAIHGATVFSIQAGERGQSLNCNWSPADLVKHYTERAAKREAELPSRYAHMRAAQYAEVTSLLNQAREVCAFFGLGHKALDARLAKRETEAANQAQVMADHRAKALSRKQKEEARQVKARTARNIQYARDYIARKLPLAYVDLSTKDNALNLLPEALRAELVACVIETNAKHYPERVKRAEQERAEREAAAARHPNRLALWQAGESVRLEHDDKTMLRAEGDEMVTSKGARVPLLDAARTYRFAAALRLKGWHKNGERHTIGAYQLDAINEAGVVAGCHRIGWEEIERFAKSQGWTS